MPCRLLVVLHVGSGLLAKAPLKKTECCTQDLTAVCQTLGWDSRGARTPNQSKGTSSAWPVNVPAMALGKARHGRE